MSLKPEIHGAGFDLDGLMFNTEDLYDKVLDDFLQARRKRFSRQLKLRMMGLPPLRAASVLREECELEESAEDIIYQVESNLMDILSGHLEMMPGLAELMILMESFQLPKAIATSSPRKLVDRVLELSGLRERFEFVLTSEDVTNGKPDPEIYQTLANRLNVRPENLLVLEDSLHGTQSAAAAGTVTVAVPGHHSAGQCFDHATFLFGSLEDERLIDLISTSVPPVADREP